MEEYIRKSEVINLLHSSLDRDTVTDYISRFKGYLIAEEGNEQSLAFTLEELKEIAGKLGYSLVKNQPKIKLEPCKCGRKIIALWYRNGVPFYKCDNCGLKAEPGKSKLMARKNWNKMILGETEEC